MFNEHPRILLMEGMAGLNTKTAPIYNIYPTFRTFQTRYRATQSRYATKHGMRQPHEVENLPVEITEVWIEALDLTAGSK